MKLLMENFRKYLKEEENPIHIFFDMDGVLVDFAGKVAELINGTIDKNPDVIYAGSKSKRKALKRLQKVREDEKITAPITSKELEQMTARKDAGQERTKMEKRISDYLFSLIANDSQVWADMEILSGAEDMVKAAQEKGTVYILTSPVQGAPDETESASAIGKKEWLSNHFPAIDSDKIIITGEKGAALQGLGIIEKGERAILIDDRTKYIDQFKGAGGEAIKHSEDDTSSTLGFLRSLGT